MNTNKWSEDELLGYLNNQLPAKLLTELEADLRTSPELRRRIEQLNGEHEIHSVGEIWRRHRLSCPSREELQQHLKDDLNNEHSRYLNFHLNIVRCEICQANFADLQTMSESQDDSKRRHQIFESSAGFLAQNHRDR